MRLDITSKYGYQDNNETFWRFTFETVAGEEGWFAWIKPPTLENFLCVGMITEKELILKLKEVPPPLTPDDFIDLELWLIKGGLDSYSPKKTRRRKKKEDVSR